MTIASASSSSSFPWRDIERRGEPGTHSVDRAGFILFNNNDMSQFQKTLLKLCALIEAEEREETNT